MAAEPLWPQMRLATGDGAYSIELHGRLLFDVGTGDGGDAKIRRARLNVAGKLAQDLFYKFENDFSVDNFREGVTDAYVGYDIAPNLYLQTGQFKEPYSIQTLTSSRFACFMERSSLTAFTPGRQLGSMIAGSQPLPEDGMVTAALGGFNGHIGGSGDDDTKDVTGRVTWAPIATPTHVLHLGLAGSYRTPDNYSDSIRYSSTPESRFTDGDAVDTGLITDTDHAMQWGLEGVGIWGPASVQAEAMQVSVDRQAGFANADFSGGSIEATYFLTGESRNYVPKRAAFDRVSPKNPVTDGGWGAWQLAARYSHIDLTDGAIDGGKMNNVSLAVNWIPQQQIVVMGDIVKVSSDPGTYVDGDDPTLFMMRLQLDF